MVVQEYFPRLPDDFLPLRFSIAVGLPITIDGGLVIPLFISVIKA